MVDDPVAAFLEDVRMQAEDHHLVPAADALRLVAAVRNALTLGTQWQQMPWLALTQEECGEQLLSDVGGALLGEQAGGGDGDA